MPYFRKKPNPLVSKAVIATLSLNMLSGSVIAADGTPEPVPNTYTDVPVPQLTGWNDANIATLDGTTGATAKSHVYASEAAKNDPAQNSFAAIYWELDNGSGRAPGIQVVTDDFDFPTNNCIMASGEAESKDFPGTTVPKTCSDSEGSSKRYFFELTSSDVPVDLAFDLGIKDIRYKGVKDPSTDGGAELEEFRETYGIGRIYRVIQKIINNTDKRIANYKFELGTGLGDSFVPLTFENDGVAFEMRAAVPREFFEGETGAPDISVWNPQRFATFSPKMFDSGERARFEPGFLDHATAGFMPPQLPTASVEKSQYIDSGLNIVDGVIGSITGNYFNIADTQSVVLPGNVLGYMLPDSLIPTVIGQYSTNEVGGESDAIVALWDGTNWRSGRAGLDGDPATTADNFGIVPLSQLQQWAAKLLGLDIPGEAPEDVVRYDSLLSDDLSGLNTDMFIYISDKLLDDTGALKIDSITLRVTANSVEAVIGSVQGSEDPEWVTPGNEAPTLASYMPANGTPVAINDSAITEATDPVTLAILSNDLLDGALLTPADGTIVIGPAAVGGNVVINGDNTITYTANNGYTGTELIGYTVEVAGVVSNAATIKVVVEAAPIPDAPIANNDSATMFKNTDLVLDVLANDELNNLNAGNVTVSISNSAVNGTASVESADNSILYTPTTDFVGFERFTYQVLVDGKVSNSALITIRVDEPVVEEITPPAPVYYKKSSSSGCSVGNSNSPFDPVLPAMFLLALAGLLTRRNKQRA